MEFEKTNQLGCVKCSLVRIQGNGKKQVWKFSIDSEDSSLPSWGFDLYWMVGSHVRWLTSAAMWIVWVVKHPPCNYYSIQGKKE